MPALLDRRLVVVTGKGGTGKSTISAAVALAAARRGKKVLVCEVVAKERVADFFGRPSSGTQIRELVPNLYSIHVRPREAMREYALMILKYETLYRIAFENAAARYFLAAAPSLAEIVMLGKVWWHASQEMERGRLRWDMVVLDAPATGHGLTFLTVPEVFLRLVSEGPLARDMRSMQSLLADPAKCSICVVTLPEEMPANEAVELDRALRQHEFPAGPLFLNAAFASRFSAQEVASVTRGGPLLTAAGEAADNHESRAALCRQYEAFLRDTVPRELVKVPFLFERSFGAQAIEKVARSIGEAL
ncbi:MAG: ArsA family ATPase [Deltaproteobacteria bacterium]|nr:MAG: ArsA family ATPase [Deltaproteobacteria bacterium]TMA75792.1 MAG: ArsA family ATPase [Deltaproteobacteria bacterium]TMB33518.1 MAG: ArsA family ATPase [Deltaproteobacteria bacterium]